jgi:hypothetical protein
MNIKEMEAMSKNGLRVVIRYSDAANSTGQRCQCPSKQGWDACRLHGAAGGAPRGEAHPNYRHGLAKVTKNAALGS